MTNDKFIDIRNAIGHVPTLSAMQDPNSEILGVTLAEAINDMMAARIEADGCGEDEWPPVVESAVNDLLDRIVRTVMLNWREREETT